jgi:F-box interacting protein
VCKDWWSLTKDSFFIDLHLSRAVRFNQPGTIVQWHTELGGREICKFVALNHLCVPQFSLDKECSGPVLVTPSCNGLLCIYDFKQSITVCNPTTQEFMDLPRATRNSVMMSVYPKCSFGFDPVRKQYKVVRFFYRKLDHLNQSYSLGCEVFTPGDTWWKLIDSISFYPIGPGVNSKGSIYWLIGSGAQNALTDKIIALNLTNEKFRDISLLATRSLFSDDDKESISLAQLEGNLCVVYIRFLGYSTMDIWMLNDYLTKKWIHKCHMRFPAWMNDLRNNIEPISMYDGKVILRWERSFYKYNLQDGKIRNVYNVTYSGPIKAFPFVESLVSLEELS